MNQDSDSLINRLRQGDPTCYRDIVQWYSPTILRSIYLLIWDREEALDVLQETMMRFVDRINNGQFLQKEGSVLGYLQTSARNLCIDRLRKRKEYLVSLEEFPEQDVVLKHTNSPDKVFDLHRFLDRFERALDQLTESQRVALVLFEIEGSSQKEIAKTINVSVSKVETDLYRARRKLRQILQPYRDVS